MKLNSLPLLLIFPVARVLNNSSKHYPQCHSLLRATTRRILELKEDSCSWLKKESNSSVYCREAAWGIFLTQNINLHNKWKHVKWLSLARLWDKEKKINKQMLRVSHEIPDIPLFFSYSVSPFCCPEAAAGPLTSWQACELAPNTNTRTHTCTHTPL